MNKRAETSPRKQKAVIFWLEKELLCVSIKICCRILSEQVFSFNYQGGILVDGILWILQWLWNAETLWRKNIEKKEPQEMSMLSQFPKLNGPGIHIAGFQLWDVLFIEGAQWVFMEVQWGIQGCSQSPGAVAVLHPAAPWALLLVPTPAALGVLLMALPWLQLLYAFVI